MAVEHRLKGGNAGSAVLVEGTVQRVLGLWTAAASALLRHLEQHHLVGATSVPGVEKHSEINVQRGSICGTFGQVRNLESDLPRDGGQQPLTENHTLKAQREFAQENRRLEECLAGERDRNRFLRKRIALLGAELAGRTVR